MTHPKNAKKKIHWLFLVVFSPKIVKKIVPLKIFEVNFTESVLFGRIFASKMQKLIWTVSAEMTSRTANMEMP